MPRRTAVTVTDIQGKKHNARIINVSATAAAVEVSPAVDPLRITHLGLTPVSTGRRITSGVVLVFAKPISPSRCNEAVTF